MSLKKRFSPIIAPPFEKIAPPFQNPRSATVSSVEFVIGYPIKVISDTISDILYHLYGRTSRKIAT